MLGKLLKYEVKATSKTFIPIYISIILISLINVTFMRNNIFIEAQNIIHLVIIAFYIGITALTIIVTTERFRKNLLGDEGYLMFTLPVKSR